MSAPRIQHLLPAVFLLCCCGDLHSVVDASPVDASLDGTPEACGEVHCSAGQRCVEGVCVTDEPCDGVVCPNPDDICQRGVCVSGGADNDDNGVVAREDCDDFDAARFPGALEVCDGIDNDCDGVIENGLPCEAGQEVACLTTCGATGVGLCSPACELPSAEDCRAQERCNGVDDDCDGVADEDFSCRAEQIERRSCGACDTGEQERRCSTECSWDDWSACVGARTDYPVDPSTEEAVCPPYDRPAVFFSPHPDDETIGMAGAILEHLAAGRDVFVEVMTHGEASGVQGRLNDGGTCPWHSGSHRYALSDDEFGDARVRELMDAVTRMDVTGVFVSDFGDGNLAAWEVDTRIDFWLIEGGDELSLKGTVGSDDLTSGGTFHDDHQAVWSALTSCGHGDIRGYFVYRYAGGRGDPDRTIDITTWCAGKGDAIDAYALWSPDLGRYAIGYHSVPAYFDDAGSSCVEYVEIP